MLSDTVFPAAAYSLATSIIDEVVTASMESELHGFETSKQQSESVHRYNFDPTWFSVYPWLKKDEQQSLGTDSAKGCYYCEYCHEVGGKSQRVSG